MYPPPGGQRSTLGVAPAGGVSCEMTPGDGGVYVDGTYVSTVDDFSPTSQPLTLAAGRHRIDVRAREYQPLAFDVDVMPGQALPYRGAMQPLPR